MRLGTLSDLLEGLRGVRVWDCPCGHFRVSATRRAARTDMIERALGEHYLECPVAQADVGLRLLVDRPAEGE